MVIDAAAVSAGVRLESFETLGSTNEEALARARAGTVGPLWIVAAQQTAGRGRRGRTWASLPGNLHATLLLTDPCPARHAAELSLVAALALHDALSRLAAAIESRLALKWPNDMLLDGAKLAGILVEGETGPPLATAVGIGVNCAHHPVDTAYPATSLAAAGLHVAPSELVAAVSRTMLERQAQWARGDGFPSIRADWLARAAGFGRPIRVTVGEQELHGRFDGIDDVGHLVLRLDDGAVRSVAAGDVFHMPPAGRSASAA
jgi:BirA family transcriptional regulator, biotin operon repressor / biotin---[acetyl-CoA-carboxylase] ligase